MTSEEIASSIRSGKTRKNARGRVSSTVLRVLGILALSAYTLAFGELFVRVFKPQPLIPRYITGTPWGVRGNIPHARYWHHTGEVDVEYRINGEGMRADREFPLQKPAGTCRIGVFGDSFLMGYELDLKDTFTTRLEQLLRTQGYRVDVLNFSVSGFGTAEMLRTYEAFARKFAPDIVLFSWHFSDVDDNVRSGLYRLSDGRLESTGNTYLPGVGTEDALMKSRLYRLVADDSQFYALIRERLNQFMKKFLEQFRQKRPDEVPAAADSAEVDPEDAAHAAQSQANMALSEAIVAHAAQTVEADGREFYLVDMPIRVSRVKFRSSLEYLPADAHPGINIVSPMAAFTKAARPDLKLYYEKGHGHFSPAGVELLVREVDRRLTDSAHLAACANR